MPIGGIIFDGYWPHTLFESADEQAWFPPRGAWDLAGTYDLIHTLQPAAVVINNHHTWPLKGEDMQVSELDMQIEDGKVRAYRAKVKLSFKYQGD